jgi:prepilin-type N-terminal cleavage/methylation domain-containing protein
MIRRAFTLIELLLVLCVIAILVAITTPALAKSLRNARIGQAAGAVVEAAKQARSMALEERQPAPLPGEAGPRCYGVLILDDPSVAPTPFVALTWGADGDGAPDERGRILVRDPHSAALSQAWRQPEWPAVLRVDLGAQATVVVGDSALATQTEKQVAWCYQYRSGLPILRCAAPEAAAPIAVGGVARTWVDYQDIPGYNPSVAVVAAAGKTSPYGLSLRSRDDGIRHAISVLPTGHASSARF